MLPDINQAHNTLLDIYNRVFFAKCAEAGMNPRDMQEAESMCKLALQLRSLESQQQKQAANNDPYAYALASLTNEMSRNGLDGQLKQAAYEAAEQQRSDAVNLLMQYPNVYDSVLALKANEAQQALEQAA